MHFCNVPRVTLKTGTTITPVQAKRPATRTTNKCKALGCSQARHEGCVPCSIRLYETCHEGGLAGKRDKINGFVYKSLLDLQNGFLYDPCLMCCCSNFGCSFVPKAPLVVCDPLTLLADSHSLYISVYTTCSRQKKSVL